jgi:hypothetical protein
MYSQTPRVRAKSTAQTDAGEKATTDSHTNLDNLASLGVSSDFAAYRDTPANDPCHYGSLKTTLRRSDQQA